MFLIQTKKKVLSSKSKSLLNDLCNVRQPTPTRHTMIILKQISNKIIQYKTFLTTVYFVSLIVVFMAKRQKDVSNPFIKIYFYFIVSDTHHYTTIDLL